MMTTRRGITRESFTKVATMFVLAAIVALGATVTPAEAGGRRRGARCAPQQNAYTNYAPNGGYAYAPPRPRGYYAPSGYNQPYYNAPYYDDDYPYRRRSSKGKTALTIAAGAGGGAVVGGLTAGKKGAVIGAIVGGVGAAVIRGVVTRDNDRDRYGYRRRY